MLTDESHTATIKRNRMFIGKRYYSSEKNKSDKGDDLPGIIANS
jgi:hypothetical protein